MLLRAKRARVRSAMVGPLSAITSARISARPSQ
jgi:hypothetical protein